VTADAALDAMAGFPGLLSDDEEGFVAQRGTCFPIPDTMIDQAHQAADACPEGAISIRETAELDA
jgi:ferredoxin